MAQRLLQIVALLIMFTIFAPFVDSRLIPYVRWPQYFACALLVWAFATQLLPAVWKNRYHDKFAVGFVVFLILLMLYAMWDRLTSWP
jgi:hypothetical protein